MIVLETRVVCFSVPEERRFADLFGERNQDYKREETSGYIIFTKKDLSYSFVQEELRKEEKKDADAKP